MNTNSKEIRIMPLSKDTLDEAVSLTPKHFYRPDQKNAQRSFSDSLMSTKFDKTYWVAVNKEGIVVGVTGLYFDRNDKSVVWLGWFGVHPKHRRQGIGSELLAFTIDEGKEGTIYYSNYIHRLMKTRKLHASCIKNSAFCKLHLI